MALRVVVVGATGNVGTSLVQALGEDPDVDSIIGLARRLPAWSPPKTTWARADVRTTDLVSHFRGADVVVHLAWILQPTHDPLATWRSNALGSVRVFDAVAEARVPALVYASSIGAYAPGRRGGGPVDESWPTHALPTAAYGREKSYVERVLDTFERDHSHIRVVRLRPAFIFKRESASAQRRLFAGPLLPGRLVRRDLIPVVPDIPGLRLQALHSADAAQAYRLAVVRPVRGAFNVAADPVLDPKTLAQFLDARPVRVPSGLVRAVIATGWHLQVIPASPTLFDLALSLPVMDSTRAREELGWQATKTSLEAIGELFEGLRAGAGMETPPLRPDAGGRLRGRELATGVGERDDA
ncbi:MAG TPA: NAD-dependent epimerase/dehydratase family protein [Actinomycetota bacterium]|nr:NAD-dependent epimerase/dehydratase family protein [Actinomycetota bacterium]